MPRLVIFYNKKKGQENIMRLKELRERYNLGQQELADYLNVRQNTYSQYENEKRCLPLDTLIKLAKYYNTSADYILELTDEKRPYPKKDSR